MSNQWDGMIAVVWLHPHATEVFTQPFCHLQVVPDHILSFYLLVHLRILFAVLDDCIEGSPVTSHYCGMNFVDASCILEE